MKKAVSVLMIIAWLAALAFAQEKEKSPTTVKSDTLKSESVKSVGCCGAGMAAAKKDAPKKMSGCKGMETCCKQEKGCCKEGGECMQKTGTKGTAPAKAPEKKS